MPVKYHIRLPPSEQQTMKDLVKSKAAHYKHTHAQILLALDENGPAMCEADVARVCAITVKTVQRIRKRAVEEGLDIAIGSKFNQRQRPAPKLDDEQHAHLVTMACSTAPKGRNRWTMESLADKLVELKIVDSISDTTVWLELKKRTAKDWARQIKQRVDVYVPNADCIRLVMDNLNTHAPASLYKAFELDEARRIRIASKLEIHYTPKHGSWLNMAEIVLSILSRQCLIIESLIRIR